MYKLYLKGSPVVFDQRITVLAPEAAEDSLEVPVMVDIKGLDGVQKVLVFADYNPLPKVLEFFPRSAESRIGFRMKLQQSSPIRAAARAGDGVWYVGGVWVDAAGGGCTLPSIGSANPQWESRLGEIDARLWPRQGGIQRLRFSVLHPMDTGLAPGVPAFYAESIDLTNDKGELLANIKPYEPVSENPIFSLDLPGETQIIVTGRDNNGNRFSAEVTP
jgi:sulfur-oxidizing protein SoxY